MWIIGLVIAVSLVLGIVILAYALKKNRQESVKETNYRVFYNMGILFLLIGFVFLILSLTTDFSYSVAIPFIAIGAPYLGIGLANKDKWAKRKKHT
jgi:L-asparagine transporter-like permease